MKKQTICKPTRSSFTLLRQLCNLIPMHLVPQLARDTGVTEKSRTFTPVPPGLGALSHFNPIFFFVVGVIHSLGWFVNNPPPSLSTLNAQPSTSPRPF
jgi:hypothetical protein